MSHYTLASGQQTTTVSLVCPTCGTRRILDAEEAVTLPHYVPVEVLCCSPDCCRHYRATRTVNAGYK